MTITIPLSDYFNDKLRGMRSYVVLDLSNSLDAATVQSLTAQADWREHVHLEPVNGTPSISNEVTPPANENLPGVTMELPPPSARPTSISPNSSPTKNLYKLWPIKEWKASIESLKISKDSSDLRVKQFNDFKRKSIIAKNKMIVSGKFSIEKIDEIFEHLSDEKYKGIREMIEKIVLPID